MKYCTKEWFDAMQCIYLHSGLKADERAGTYSEAYFQELYAQNIQERLDFMQGVSEVDLKELAAKFTECATSETPLARVDGGEISPDEQELVRKIGLSIADSLLDAQPFVFDPEAEAQIAHDIYLHDLQRLESSLPDEILSKVADIRVLALGYATCEIIDDIKNFCKATETAVRTASDEYTEEFNHNFGDAPPRFHTDYDFHDYKVISFQTEGEDILLKLDGYSCRFLNAEITGPDVPLEGAYWLYDAVYPTAGGFEFLILMQKDESILEINILCRDVQISRNSE